MNVSDVAMFPLSILPPPLSAKNAQRVIRSQVFSKSVCRHRTPTCPALRRRYLSLSSSTRSRATRSPSLLLSSASHSPCPVRAKLAQRREI